MAAMPRISRDRCPPTGNSPLASVKFMEIVLGAQNAARCGCKTGSANVCGPGSLQQIVTDYFNAHGHDQEGPFAWPLLYSRRESSSPAWTCMILAIPKAATLEANMVITVRAGDFTFRKKISRCTHRG